MKEIVIEIPDELISKINDENYQNVISWFATTLYCAIKNGKVLPKGHGELKDTTTIVDKLTDTDIYLTDEDWNEIGKALRSAEVLIEADKQ